MCEVVKFFDTYGKDQEESWASFKVFRWVGRKSANKKISNGTV